MKATTDVVGPVLVGLGVIAIIAFFSWRKYRSSWQGVVVETVYVRGDNEGGQDEFYIICHSDAGKRIKVSVGGRAILDGYKKGQRVVKKPGEIWPRVLPSLSETAH